jgi:hypothetical protein
VARLQLVADTKDYRALLGDLRTEERKAVIGVNNVIERRTLRLKERLRRNIDRRFAKTDRLRNTIQSKFSPWTRRHPGAVGVVFSTFVAKRDGGRLDLFRAFESPQVIKATGGSFLVLPAGSSSRRSKRRALLTGAQLIPIYRTRRGGAVATTRATTSKRRRGRRRQPIGYVALRGGQVVAVLLKQVKLKKRNIGIDREFARALEGLDRDVVRAIDRAVPSGVSGG